MSGRVGCKVHIEGIAAVTPRGGDLSTPTATSTAGIAGHVIGQSASESSGSVATAAAWRMRSRGACSVAPGTPHRTGHGHPEIGPNVLGV